MSHSHRFFPHFQNGRYANYVGDKHHPVELGSLKILAEGLLNLGHDRAIMRDWIIPHAPHSETSDVTQITWIGHATFLITIAGKHILTDPVFGSLTLFVPRLVKPGILPQQLPAIDVVVISHNHRDHMDADALYWLYAHTKCIFLVPQGDKTWFNRRGMGERVVEMMWWEQHQVGTIIFSFLPAHHWSQRGLFDFNKSLWGSWMMQATKGSTQDTLYFAGDTAYGRHFSAIAQEFPRIDTVLMPIGPCEPMSWMTYSHVNPQQAVKGFIELGAHTFVPMHWGAYRLGSESPLLPIERLSHAWQLEVDAALLHKQLEVLKVGQSCKSIPTLLQVSDVSSESVIQR